MARENILRHLESERWISGEKIAQSEGISRAAIWKQIKTLRRRGYEIESSTKKGYRLMNKPDFIDPDAIFSGLKTKWLGRPIHYCFEVESTNDIAKSIVSSSPSGTLVLAELQTQGRGRLSRDWTSPAGGIWMSLILKPDMPLAKAYQLNMAASVSVVRSIRTLYGLDAGIKWPNDILIRGRKICGILMELSAQVDRLDWAVVGMGINANVDIKIFPEEWNATSLFNELGRNIMRAEFIQNILLEMEGILNSSDIKETYLEWRSSSVTLGRRVRIESISGDLIGVAEDLLADGTICIKTPDGLKRVISGDCIHLRVEEGSC